MLDESIAHNQSGADPGSVMAALYDILLALSPIGLLWHVQIETRNKWLLCGLLALGFLYSPSLISSDITELTSR